MSIANFALSYTSTSAFISDEVLALAGCDLLTISPKLLENLEADQTTKVERCLDASATSNLEMERLSLDERTFRWMLNEDQMATDKLSDGIRKFATDAVKLESFISAKLNA